MDAKRIAAEKAVDYIKPGMTVSLGSGSTASLAIHRIGERVKEGLTITAVASSVKSEAIAREWNIPLRELSAIDTIDIAIDGADEVDAKGNLIKGGGGSLLREKLLAFSSKAFYVIVDESKLVNRVGTKVLPVEIVPFGANLTLRHLRALGCVPSIRKIKSDNFITDNGNLIVDCQFVSIDEPAWLDVKIKMIPGVIETGLFSSKVVTAIIIGYETGEIREIFI
jgi:ribose 5-phosphate isomerase A